MAAMNTRQGTRGLALRRVKESGYLGAAGLIVLATGIGFLLRSRVNPIDIAMLYLLAVVMAAARFDRRPALVAGALSVALFDFFFVPPYLTFVVLDQSYILSFGIMFVVALTMSQLTGRIREQAREAEEHRRHTEALYAMVRELAAAGAGDPVAIAARHIGRAAAGDAELLLMERTDWPATPPFDSVDVRMAATWAFENGTAAGWSTRHGPEGEAMIAPLKTPNRTLGVAVIRPRNPERTLPESAVRTVEALAEQAAIALERRVSP
ncbi:MAG: DUF4118 domain-containing protein [Gemmatimonadales bacterium]|nr:DUF4118 domain-containing protein [Gemmatimonadales bacterium]